MLHMQKLRHIHVLLEQEACEVFEIHMSSKDGVRYLSV